jgi:hypothetical protein
MAVVEALTLLGTTAGVQFAAVLKSLEPGARFQVAVCELTATGSKVVHAESTIAASFAAIRSFNFPPVGIRLPSPVRQMISGSLHRIAEYRAKLRLAAPPSQENLIR